MTRLRRAMTFGAVLAASLVVSVLLWIDHAQDERLRMGNMVLSAVVVLAIALLQLMMAHERARLAHLLDQVLDDNERLLTTDDLTGLRNRRHFFQILEREATEHLMTGQPMAVIVIDLDHFKTINKDHGRAVGDLVLSEIGHTIRRAARARDIMARLEGDTFVCLLTAITEDTAVGIGERLREGIRHTKITLTSGGRIPVTASIGVAAVTGRAEVDLDRLLDRATRAMSKAREFGMDRVVCARLPVQGYPTRAVYDAIEAGKRQPLDDDPS